MFPPTADRLADAAKVHQPIHDTSPGAAWLMATAARAAEVQQQLAEGHNRATLVTLHAHYAVEDPSFDPCMVAADLHVPLYHRARASGQQFAASVALFRVARGLLDRLTAPEPDALGPRRAPRRRSRRRGRHVLRRREQPRPTTRSREERTALVRHRGRMRVAEPEPPELPGRRRGLGTLPR